MRFQHLILLNALINLLRTNEASPKADTFLPPSSSRAPFLLDAMADPTPGPSSADLAKRKNQRDLTDASSRDSDDEESRTRDSTNAIDRKAKHKV
jgi:hypothetical protein